MGVWGDFVALGRSVIAIRVAAERADERVELVAARVERLADLNEALWSHHLVFCGQVTAEVANAEREILAELDALRQWLIDVGDDDKEPRSAPPSQPAGVEIEQTPV